MSDQPPDPLVPPEVDLRGLPFMPLDVVRLMDSDLFALSTGDEFKAAVALWCKSWLQVPASSLPNEDRVLAHLSGAGARWKKLKSMALRGWVLCADERWYHPVVADKARAAWAHRIAQRERAAKRWQSHGTSGGTSSGNAAASPAAMQGRGRVKGEPLASSTGTPPPEAPTRAGEIALLLRRLASERLKTVRIGAIDKVVDEWAAKGVSDQHIAAAFADAVQDRELKGDASAITAGFVDVFVAKILNPQQRGSRINGTAPALDWWSDPAGIFAKAQTEGVEIAMRHNGDAEVRDPVATRARLCLKLGPGPWVDERNATLMRLIAEERERAAA